MRILHLASGDLWAGAEAQALTLLSSLRQAPDVELTAVLMNEGELAARLRSRGIRVVILDEQQLSSVEILKALLRLLRSLRPDLVHTHRTKENVLGSIACRLTGSIPSVRTVHGAPEHALTGWKQFHKSVPSHLERWCGRHLQERLIAVSKDLAGKLSQEYSAERIVVIENGIDSESVLADVHPVELRDAHPRAWHVGIVGRLVPVKRVDLFLQSAALLRAQYPSQDWHFHVIGDGPLRAPLAAEATELGISDAVTFHGHRGDSVACLAALDCLLMCSDHEGLPMTALEAMVVGTPVVAHAVGGLTDLLPSEWLVSRHEPVWYAEALQRLRGSPAHQASAQLPPRFSSATNAERVLTLYRDVLSASRRGWRS